MTNDDDDDGRHGDRGRNHGKSGRGSEVSSRRRSRDDRSHSRERPQKRHKREKHPRDDSYDSSSASASSGSSRSARRKHKRKHRKEKKKKHKKKKDRKHKKTSDRKSNRRRSPSVSPSRSPHATTPPAPPGAHELASALTQLFRSYPAMTSLDEGGIPLLLIQLSRGTEYNLSQMPDRNLAQLLEVVFEALRVHGMEVGGNGAWKWGNAAPSGGRQGGDDLALLRLTRALLNGVGFTMERVEKFEQDQRQSQQTDLHLLEKQRSDAQEQEKQSAMENEEKKKEDEKDFRHKKRVERMTSQMLDRFDAKSSSASESSLANELRGLCDVLMEGESVQLDGIENGKLKATLGQLFQLIGLELVDMEDEDDEEGDPSKGYALPDSADRGSVASNLNEVLRVCRFRSSGGSEGAPKSWAAKSDANRGSVPAEEESSSDDDDGPAPLGTVAAAKAAKRTRTASQMQNAKSAKAGGVEEGGREEWMMVPGEHDFLTGVATSTRSRTFKNEKNRGQPIAPAQSAGPINPQVLEEVSAIQRAYEESRGPSLLDEHRQKNQELKQQQQGQNKEWKWSRDKNLDDGRRVDKNALHQVMGGASTELKSKFQGSLGR